MKQEIKALTPIRLDENSNVEGTRYVCSIQFSNGERIPMFEAFTTHGFNQLLGKAKFINREYGAVFYRGQNELYDNLMPSLFRGNCRVKAASVRISEKIKEIIQDSKLHNNLKLGTNGKEKVEAVMQHYGCKTRFLDLVDNHWVALWMGLHTLRERKLVQRYYRYIPRLYYDLDCVPMLETKETKKSTAVSSSSSLTGETEKAENQFFCSSQTFSVTITEENYKNNNLYLFVLLIAAPTMGSGKKGKNEEGIIENDVVILADLRKCLPSVFLRPHAQHALVLKKKGNPEEGKKSFDLSENIVGIICVRLDRAKDWLGTGKFLTQDNLFPPPMFDHGYDILLLRSDIFNKPEFQILKYV